MKVTPLLVICLALIANELVGPIRIWVPTFVPQKPLNTKDAYRKSYLDAAKLIDNAAVARLAVMKDEWVVAESAGDEDTKARLLKESLDIKHDLEWVETTLAR